MNSDDPVVPVCPKVNAGVVPLAPDACGNPVAPVAGEDGALEPKVNGLGAPAGAPNVNAGVLENGLLDVAPVAGCADCAGAANGFAGGADGCCPKVNGDDVVPDV